jgi:NADPH:quinone reductase-like Zn-dependent oxidoreductase
LVAEPTSENLQRLAGLLEAGKLNVHIQSTYPLDQGTEALNALATTHTQGKIALQVN